MGRIGMGTGGGSKDDDHVIASMKRGGKVKRTGTYRLHKGEEVKRSKKRGRKRGSK